MRQFSLTFLPSLIGVHLTHLNGPPIEKRLYSCVDVLLLAIYNLEVVDEDGTPIKRTFRFPNLSKPSIYHEPSVAANQVNSAPSALTEHALHRHESGSASDYFIVNSFGPYSYFEEMVAANRFPILTVLLKVYNCNIRSLPIQSLQAVCHNGLK